MTILRASGSAPRRALAAVAALALLSAACAGPVGGEPPAESFASMDEGVSTAALDPNGPSTTPGLPDPCLAKAADVTGSFGPNQASAYYGTTSTAYSTTPCGRFVMDLHVPSTHTAPDFTFPEMTLSAYSLSAGEKGYVIGATADDCDESWVRVTFYKKGAGETSWKTIGGGLRRGKWDSYGTGSCRITPLSTYKAPPEQLAPVSGTDLYRFAVAVKYKGAYSGVAMLAKHEADEPR